MKNRTAFLLLVAGIALAGCAPQPEASSILQISLSARGVAYTVAVNGVASDMLGSDNLIGSTASGPLGALGLKTQPGTNTIEVTVHEVAPEKTPFLHIDLQEFQEGEVVDTTESTSPRVLVSADLTEGQLVVGAQLKYTFNLP